MRPQLCGALGTAEPRLGALVSWHWEAHKLLYQEPGGVQAKGVARKGKLRPAQGPLSVSTAYRVPLNPFTELVSAGPSPGGGSTFLPFQKKGLPRGLRASQSYTYQRLKENVENLLLLPTLFSLRRRLQVEKSPVGAA